MPRDRELIIATVKENVSLSVFDASTGERIAVVSVGEKNVSKPHEIAMSKDGARAFVHGFGRDGEGQPGRERQGLLGTSKNEIEIPRFGFDR